MGWCAGEYCFADVLDGDWVTHCRREVDERAHEVDAVGGDGHSFGMWLNDSCLKVVLSSSPPSN